MIITITIKRVLKAVAVLLLRFSLTPTRREPAEAAATVVQETARYLTSSLASGFLWCAHYLSAAAAAESLQSCPTLCDPMDGSPPGSPVPGTLQARTLERAAIPSSNA